MTPRPSCFQRPRGTALGTCWLVLVVFLFGAILSSVGGTYSHGIAAIMAADHATAAPSSPSHGHAHALEDGAWPIADGDAMADHPHHGADHSHDKAHDLPVAWSGTAPLRAAWIGRARPWTDMVQASRLERPPMG